MNKNYKSLAYMFLATIFYAIMHVFVKCITLLPSINLTFLSGICSFIFIYIIASHNNISILGKNYKLLLVRGISGTIASILFFVSIKNISLSVSVTIQYLSPLFSTVFALFFLNEKIKPIQIIFFMISFIGIMIIGQFDFSIKKIYLITAILGALFSGVAFASIKKIGLKENPLTIILYLYLITIPITGIYSITHWVKPTKFEVFLIIGISCTAIIARYFQTKSYQLGKINQVSSVMYLGIIHSLILDFIFFNQKLSPITLLGIIMIISGVILNIIYSKN